MRRRVRWALARRRPARPARRALPVPRSPRAVDVTCTLLDALEDAALMVDGDRAIRAWNRAMERLTGLPRPRALGRRLAGLSPILDDLALDEHLARARGGEQAFTAEVTEAAARPQGLCVEGRCRPLRDATGEPRGAVAVLRDVTEARRQALFVGAMATIARSLTTSLDPNEVLDTVVAKARDVMRAEAALVVAWDGAQRRIAVLRAGGRLSAQYAPDGAIPFAGGPISRAIAERRVVTTRDILGDPLTSLSPERRAHVEREGFRAVAAVPLVSKGRVHGALAVHYWHERAFGEEEVLALSLMGEQAALAIDNARLYADATRRAERLRELAEVEHLVASSLDLDEVLRRIVEAVGRLLGVPVVHLFTTEPGGGRLRLRVSFVERALPPLEIPAMLEPGQGLTGLAAERRTAVFSADPARDPRTHPVVAERAGLGPILAVPILSGEELLGVLTVRARATELAGEEDRALVGSLAARAALAIQHARAYTDALRRAARLRDLASISQSIAGSLDVDEVMRRIAGAAAGLRPGALSAVHLYDAERDQLRFAAFSDEVLRELPDGRPAREGLSGLVVERQAAVLVGRPADDPRTSAPAWWRARPNASYYGVPIMLGEAFLGVLDYVVPDGVPDAEEQEVLRLLASHAGIAIRNASLYAAERAQAERAGALAAINRRISSSLDLDPLLSMISESAASLTGVRYASFWLADERSRQLTIKGGSIRAIVDDFPQPVIGYDAGGIGWVARTRQPLVVDDVFSDPRMLNPDWWRRWGIGAFACFPVMAGDELLAVLALCHSEPVRLAASTREVVEMFIAQASVAIQNARLYRATVRRQEVAEVLARLGRELTGTLDLARLAERIAQIVTELIPCLGSLVYRYEPAEGTLHNVAAVGSMRDPGRGLVLGPGEGACGRAVAERRVVTIDNLLEERDLPVSENLHSRIQAAGHRAAVGVPLIAREQVVGALAIGAEAGRVFSDEELQLLQAVADQAALALEGARLYESARESLARLRETQSQLLQAGKMSALGQLVSGVAHELNNPLSVIIGYGQLLLHRQIPEEYRKPVELMVAQGDRMAKIVRNLLYFARQRPPERAPVDLNKVIDEALALRQHQLTLAGIQVERDIVDVPAVNGDAQQLQQVFLNLLLNAEQAIIGAGRGGRIVFRTRVVEAAAAAGKPGRPPQRGETGRRVRAEVIDDGPGIPAEALPHVFEPFFTTKEVGAGTGLGLSVSYGIVEEHGGTLSVQSEPGRTVFALELSAVATPASSAARVVVLPSFSGAGRRALVVEDEEGVADLVVTLLEETGWNVDLAPGGRAGLDRVRRQHYDLVVSDIRMPDGGGEDLYRNAIAEDASLQRRFIFMTGDTASPAAWSFVKSVSAPVVEKPFQADMFLDLVRRVASGG